MNRAPTVRYAPTALPGVLLIDQERHEDERGYFARTMCRAAFTARGLVTDYAQDSLSLSRRRGTLRGLHFQTGPYAETKLVRCSRGAIYDVVVDLRPGSATYARWQGFELSAETGRSLYIPEGFAHGFQTLADETEVFYRISRPYEASAAAGVRYDDPCLCIRWPEPVTVISARDAAWPPLERPTEPRSSRAAAL